MLENLRYKMVDYFYNNFFFLIMLIIFFLLIIMIFFFFSMFLFSFLDVVVEEWKEELGEKVVIFVFKKEDYVKIFLDNFCDM